jgi:signal transduction histidine kinase
MTTISGFIDGILAGAIPPEKHEHYLGVIAGEVKRLSRLVTTLLDVTRLQGGERKFVMTDFDVCEMARQILISFEQKIDAKRLDVEFECDEENMFANADRDAIYQILYNICDNAVKFSCERGKLSLTLRNTKDKKVLIRVFNEGIGIPPQDVPFIFERFYKSDKSRGLDKSGVGLGMFIAKTIIDAHHEKIWVESEYRKNCAFQFTLAKVDPPEGHNHLPEIEVYHGK